MPGDYLFPKRRFKHGEPLDAEELNEALQPPGERLNGFLGPHNVRAPLDPDIVAARDTFFRTRQVFVDVAPGLSNGNSSPSASTTDGYTIEQDTSWQVIEANTADKDMSIELATGASTLAMTASLSYCLSGDDVEVKAEYTLNLEFLSGDHYTFFYHHNDKLLSMRVALEGPADSATATSGQYHNFVINLPPPGNMQSIRKEMAKRIANVGIDHLADQADYADPPWGASGYTARAQETNVIFTRIAPGSATAGTFFWAWPQDPSVLTIPVTTITQSTTAVLGTSGNKLSDLASSDTTGGAGGAMVYFAGQVQFALRVDGVVLTDTITGRYDNEQGSFQPGQLENPVSTLVGLGLTRLKNRPDALGLPMYTVRLTYNVDVRPGAHQVDLVARRVPMGPRRKFRTEMPNVGSRPTDPYLMPMDNRVVVFNRQLKVIDIPQEGLTTSRFDATVEVPDFTYEDVVSRASLDTDRLRKVVDGSNAVESFQVARGAINGAHLSEYSSVLAVAQGILTSGSLTLNASTNGYSRLTAGVANFGQFYNLYPLAGGWTAVVTAKLSEPVVAGTVLPPDGNPCVISIEGNVFLNKLQTVAAATSISGSGNDTMHLGAATFCVGVESGGVWYLWMPSLAWVNSNQYWASEATGSATLDVIAHPSNYSDNDGHDYYDVPVTAELLFNYDDLGLTRQIDQVGIFGAACSMTTGIPTTELTVQYASVNAVATKS